MCADVVNEEELIEFSVRQVLSCQRDARKLVHDLALGWPQAGAQQLVYVLSITAGTIEHMLAGPEVARVAQDVWRMAGLVGVDIHMMQVMGLAAGTAADLMSYWQAHDPFFLD